MNFSVNRNHKKRLSLVLALVMILTLFAGCKKEASSDTEPGSNPGLNIDLNDATVPTTEPTTPTTEETKPSENMATVTSRINVRSRPAVDKPIVYTLEAGDRIEITSQEYVMGYNWGYTPSVPGGGYVVMDFVEMDNKTDPVDDTMTPAQKDPSLAPTEGPAETPSASTTVKTRVTVTAIELKIRSEASTNGKVLGVYKKGDTVTVTETKDGWGKTDKGWISMQYVTTASSGSTGSSSGTGTDTGSSGSSGSSIQSNGSTTVLSKGIVNTGELNVRSKPSKDGDKLATLKYGARVEILETSGNWGRTSKGWIHMGYIYKDGTTGKNTDSGTVTGNELNIRSGPGTQYPSVGHYNAGDRVKILEKFTYDNTVWGCTNKGWISLTYVDLDSKSSDDDSDDSTTSSGRTGWVTAPELNIREGAGTSYDAVGSYLKGDKVTILETSGNWGRTNKGWISLNFVDFDNAPSKDNDKTGTGTVTATELRIREGAGIDYEVVGSYKYGDEITILETKNGWGRTNLGWVSLDFVDMD